MKRPTRTAKPTVQVCTLVVTRMGGREETIQHVPVEDAEQLLVMVDAYRQVATLRESHAPNEEVRRVLKEALHLKPSPRPVTEVTEVQLSLCIATVLRGTIRNRTYKRVEPWKMASATIQDVIDVTP